MGKILSLVRSDVSEFWETKDFCVVRGGFFSLLFTNLFPAMREGDDSLRHPLAVRFTFTKRLDGARARGGFLPSSEVDSSVFTPMSPPLP